MKKHFLLFTALILFASWLQAQVVVNSDITGSTTWTSNNIYLLQGGCLYVRNDATLTIEPGTIIKGDEAALIILPGSKIIADGTPERPIVFTSNQPAGLRARGDWGGLTLLGKAPINVVGGTATVEGGCTEAVYGGTDAADNSGILRYVRIEFAGTTFQINNELNSLTLGGVGSGTVIEHVQSSYGDDDAFEWFGGTVNGKYLITYRTKDDMFDTDFGYQGKNQWVLAVSDPGTADVSGSNGFESDNDGTGTTNTPRTDAKFSNVSIFGPKQTPSTTIHTDYRRSAHIRRSSLQDIFNSVFTGFPTGLRLESANSETAFLTSGEVKLKNNVYAGMTKLLDSTSVNSLTTVKAKLETENTVFAAVADLMVSDPFNETNPNFLPLAGSPLLLGADFTSPELTDPFFTTTTYRGAFGDTDWTNCWAEWDPINADYSTAPLVYITKPTVTAGGATTFCQGGSVILSAPVGFQYAWSNGATTQDITVIAGGSYSVTVSSNRGCAMSSDAVAVTVNPTPAADFTFQVNGATVLFANASAGATAYTWNFGDGSTSAAPSPTHTFTAAGNYTVCLTAKTAAGCSNEKCLTVTTTGAPTQVILDADITSNQTWTNDNIYVLQGGCLYVRNNSTLTVQPGTVVRGNAAALIVLPGSKLIADGTAAQPIVFTSNKPAGQRARGDWGGIVLLGKAPINVPGGTATVEGGCTDAIYGGTDAADNSGILRYVRIEFAGTTFQINNELNSLTMGGVGTGTVIEHVQSSYGDDDAFEWFGGTVNGKWLITYRTKDDMFDTDFGYQGKNQWVLGVSDPATADVSGSNGFESDNDGTGTTNSPRTDAKFSNVSIFGPKQTPATTIATDYRRSGHLRRSTLQDIFNSVFTGFPTGLRLESSNSEGAYLNTGELKLLNNVYAGMTKLVDSTSVNSLTLVKAKLEAENTVLPAVADLLVSDPFNATNPNFLPLAGSPLLSGASFTSPELTDPFFTATTYRGAFSNTDWTDCWAEWDPINANYENAIDYRLNPGISHNATLNSLTVDFTGTTANAVAYAWDFGDGQTSTQENPSHTYAAFAPYTVTLTVTSSRGCTATTTSTVDVETGTNEVEGLRSLKVFPNPFSHRTTVEFSLDNSMEMEIRLLDLTGRVLHSERQFFAAGKNSFPVSGDNLGAGTYFLRLMSEEGQQTVRVSVVK